MPEVICAVEDCDRPVSDAGVCTGCIWKLKKALGNIGAYEPQLDLALARQTRYEDHSEPTKGDKVLPLFFDDRASEAAWVLQNTLSTWSRLVAEERGHELPADRLTSMAAYLLCSAEWLRHHRAGHEAVEEITAAVWEAGRVIDRPHNRTTFPVGPCPELGCVGEVRVFIPAREDRPAHMSCRMCGSRWGSHEWLRAGRRIVIAEQQRITPYVNTATAAIALGVSDRHIRRLLVQGMLTNYGTSGRILLDMVEIDALATRRDERESAS